VQAAALLWVILIKELKLPGEAADVIVREGAEEAMQRYNRF
jgi:hypothetical protein